MSALSTMLEGRFELTIKGEIYSLRKGDLFVFKSNDPHSFTNPFDEVARVVWINTPPTF